MLAKDRAAFRLSLSGCHVAACTIPQFGLQCDQIGRILETLMLRLSKKTDYALIAMKHLARDPLGRAATAREIANTYALPVELTAKVLTRLVRSGLLTSHQGAHGGYELARPPAATSVAAVLEAIDGPLTMTACTQGDGGCGQLSKSNVRDPLHHIWDRIAAILAACSISEIAADRDPSAPPVAVIPSPAVRRVSAVSAATREP